MKHPIFFVLAAAIIWLSCAPSITSLAETDPKKVIANQDSLLAANPNDKIIQAALIIAHLTIAKTSSAPENSFNNVLALDPNNIEAKYHLAILDGHKLYKKGDSPSLWNALESYAGAAVLIDSLGEAHYWMGRVYEKKDSQDFELIIEAYEKAISLHIHPTVRSDAMRYLSEVKARQKTYEEFWK
jgi:tetratricopeptide (TPR) repeat protein